MTDSNNTFFDPRKMENMPIDELRKYARCQDDRLAKAYQRNLDYQAEHYKYVKQMDAFMNKQEQHASNEEALNKCQGEIKKLKRENQSLRAEAKPPARSRKNVPALKTKPAILRKTVATHLL